MYTEILVMLLVNNTWWVKHRSLCMGQASEVCEASVSGSFKLFHLLFKLHLCCSQQQNLCSSWEKEKNWLVFFFSSSSLQKLQENTTSCQRPAHDRKRKFIKSDLALDTEGRQRAEGEVNFTASKHLAKFNWFVATCAANYRISITTQRPVMTLTSLCQWSETQIDLLLAAHVPPELQWLWLHISSP